MYRAILSAGGALPAAYDGKPGGALLIGAPNQGAIVGSASGNDIIIGGSTVTTGNGDDIILAGGTETITVGSGKNEILSSSSNMNDRYTSQMLRCRVWTLIDTDGLSGGGRGGRFWGRATFRHRSRAPIVTMAWQFHLIAIDRRQTS